MGVTIVATSTDNRQSNHMITHCNKSYVYYKVKPYISGSHHSPVWNGYRTICLPTNITMLIIHRLITFHLSIIHEKLDIGICNFDIVPLFCTPPVTFL